MTEFKFPASDVDERLRDNVGDLVSHFHDSQGTRLGNEKRWGRKGGLKSERPEARHVYGEVKRTAPLHQ